MSVVKTSIKADHDDLNSGTEQPHKHRFPETMIFCLIKNEQLFIERIQHRMLDIQETELVNAGPRATQDFAMKKS